MLPKDATRSAELSKSDYPRLPHFLPDVAFTTGHYHLRFARTPGDLDAVLRLRFEVFNLEMGEGLEASFATQKDEDEHDMSCHHLMVVDIRTDEVIGTYRMQTWEMAREGAGFYSETEFDLTTLDNGLLQEAVELGRACIAKDHRNGRVLFLLWKGLVAYVSSNRKRYFFGCCSLTSQDPVEGKKVMNFLEAHGYVHDQWRCRPQPGFACYDPDLDLEGCDGVKLPKLMRLYLQYGAKISGPPAIDRLFKTIDYLAVFDVEAIDDRVRKMFAV